MIEVTQPERVRVHIPDGVQVELENPLVEGDQLLGTNGVALPLADVLMLEIREFDIVRTVGLVLLLSPLTALVCLGGGCMGG